MCAPHQWPKLVTWCHKISGEICLSVTMLPVTAYKVWPLPQHSDQLFQMHHKRHPKWVHNCLDRQMLQSRLESPPENHESSWTTCSIDNKLPALKYATLYCCFTRVFYSMLHIATFCLYYLLHSCSQTITFFSIYSAGLYFTYLLTRHTYKGP